MRRILFVDDEQMVLDGLKRMLRSLRHEWQMDFVLNGSAALEAMESEPYDVIVADMKMPGMDGITFFAQVRKESPDSVCVILSGQAELESAIAAVNEGNIFRFLTKPCPTELLLKTLVAALEQHRLIVAEQELLEKTLSGAIKVLTEILSLVNPEAFSRASRVQKYAEEIAEDLGMSDRWQLRLAAMLSQIGCITLPPDTLAKLDAGQELSEKERQLFVSHPKIAGKLLSNIPRLETVAAMVRDQMNQVDPSTLPADPQQCNSEVLGAQILRAAIEFDRLLTQGISRPKALEQLKQPSKEVPPMILKALRNLRVARTKMASRTVKMSELKISMVLDEDITAKTGARIAPKGQEVTNTVLARLRNFAEGVGIVEPFRVLMPLSAPHPRNRKVHS
ncbi:response regulator [bacterium]|nr:response regulator [bacterium]